MKTNDNVVPYSIFKIKKALREEEKRLDSEPQVDDLEEYGLSGIDWFGEDEDASDPGA